MMLHIDTQQVHSALVAGGFSQQQADTVIETMRSIDLSHLATKDDLKAMEQATKSDLKAMEQKMDRQFSEHGQHFSELEHRLEKRFAALESDNRLLKWMMGFVLAGIASLVANTFFG